MTYDLWYYNDLDNEKLTKERLEQEAEALHFLLQTNNPTKPFARRDDESRLIQSHYLLQARE